MLPTSPRTTREKVGKFTTGTSTLSATFRTSRLSTSSPASLAPIRRVPASGTRGRASTSSITWFASSRSRDTRTSSDRSSTSPAPSSKKLPDASFTACCSRGTRHLLCREARVTPFVVLKSARSVLVSIAKPSGRIWNLGLCRSMARCGTNGGVDGPGGRAVMGSPVFSVAAASITEPLCSRLSRAISAIGSARSAGRQYTPMPRTTSWRPVRTFTGTCSSTTPSRYFTRRTNRSGFENLWSGRLRPMPLKSRSGRSDAIRR